MRAAAIQLNSNQDKRRNLDRAERLLREAAADGATLVVLPEKFNVLGGPDDLRAGAEPIPGPTTDWAAGLARELGLWLVAGSIVERRPGEEKLGNTSVLAGPDGELHAAYRKIHLFDVEVGGTVYRESDTEAPGDEVVVADAGGLELGMAVCYDLRFPELYAALVKKGAQILTVPSAFTLMTGKDHWYALLRARAIETQCYVIAPAQSGRHDDQGLRHSYGHSLVIDPWGQVIGSASDGPGLALAEVDLDRVSRVRRQIPVADHRRV
jgi:predicted amidohydrolase